MANIKFTNFARSRLSVGVSAGATSITVTAGTGSKFPSPTGAEYFYLTLENASLVREIVKVTARATDVLTVVRAQDNTTAHTWNAGDVASLRLNAKAIEDVLGTTVTATSATGSAILPTGTSGQRDGSPVNGYLRYNTTTSSFEGYSGTAWGSIGGGATGGGTDDIFYENGKTVTANYTITSGKNAMSAGPITINDGVTVIIPDGCAWVING